MRSNPIETTMNISDTDQQTTRLVLSVARGESRVLVEEGGMAVAAIISIDEYRRFKDHEQHQRAVRPEVIDAWARFSDAFDNVSDDELERQISRAQAEVRADLRLKRGNSRPA